MAGFENGIDRSFLKRFAWLSIAAAVATIGIKTVAYFLTGSVGLLSDAMESLVNLVGGLMALAMLNVAARPADHNHAYGHSKAEYFSSLLEGTLILVAAAGIAWAAVPRLIEPKELEQVGLGLGVSVTASLINLGVALVLMRVAKKYHSITLESNSRHLMTDVWTSGGVLAGVGLVALTGWQRLDPVVALVVAANIIWTGVQIIRKSVLGLMDTGPGDEIIQQITQAVAALEGVEDCHQVRIRQSAASWFVDLHVAIDGSATVKDSHAATEIIEKTVHEFLPGSDVTVHVEPAGKK
jgi:cation diffusion facilitator family transporter